MKTALIVGSTGLIGNILLQKLINSDDYEKVISIVRKPSGISHPKLDERIIDFDKLGNLDLTADDVFCCLGTTMKKAGSKDAFYKVDYEYPVSVAKLAKKNGAKQYALITAMGADAKSMIYYNRVKGDVEKSIEEIGFETFLIYRPSMLLGDRKESRSGESIGQVVMTTLDFMIPKKYKAIQGEKVANAMLKTTLQGLKGVQIFESDKLQDF